MKETYRNKKTFIIYEINYYTKDSVTEVGRKHPDWFINEVNRIGEKIITKSGIEYFIIGVQETDEDYYYILKSSDDKVKYISCCIKLEDL